MMTRWPAYLPKSKYLYGKMRSKYHRDYYHNHKYLDTDSIIVSYPKCGKGWINDMLLNVFSILHDIDPLSIKDPYHLVSLMEMYGMSTFSFSHDFDPHKQKYDEIQCHLDRYQGRKIIFLQRDPRDIIVSWFYYKNYRISRGQNSDDLSVFDAFYDDIGGMESVLRFLEQWTDATRHASDITVVHYEDFIAEPKDGLSNLLKSLGYQAVSPDIIDRAVAASSFDAMRRREELGQFRNFARKVELDGDPRRYKTRSGKVGSYKSDLTVDQIAMIDERFGRRLERLGYVS